jgi:leucyl-tRNA synthetase
MVDANAAERGSGRQAHRYSAALANEIEARWQEHWSSHRTFHAPNPGEPGFDPARPKKLILDMFPYPSGVGLHVGHPLGYIATDVYARFLRMTGHNVLHPMGYDAFGLPAEQYAIQTGQHPRVTTERNIATMRAQMRRLGLGHDPLREIATTDVEFYRWTQWIFLQVFNAWYDAKADRARPIAELVPILERDGWDGKAWSSLSEIDRRRAVDAHRLAYVAEIPVNWCPALGTVLANEEVTADGRSERGNHAVFKRPLRQWMMRITAYCERLLRDLAPLDWPEPIKLMQRNWIGRSEGAEVDFLALARGGEDGAAWLRERKRSGWPDSAATEADVIRVFTTRPDTLYGATYMVLAPEHPAVDRLTASDWPAGAPVSWRGKLPGAPVAASPREMVAAYRRYAESRSDVERQLETREKTGVFTGSFAFNPTTGERIPIFIADYVLLGYGTGAIMAVPAHDGRDFEFAQQLGVPIRLVVRDPAGSTASEPLAGAFEADGIAVNSPLIDGLATPAARKRITEWLEAHGVGRGTVNYRLRDWLFSRQRYWGEPFPIVYDETGLPVALDESELPVELPEMSDYAPEVSDDPHSAPQPPLARARSWTVLRRHGKTVTRELNTMPNWAGSCWYYLRYLDPRNARRLVDPGVERYWMLTPVAGSTRPAKYDPATARIGGVDLYVGGAEHAVLHLLYARFWHKVLFDLGHVSTPEPFHRLFNQGYVQAAAYTDERGAYCEASKVEERDGAYFHEGKPVRRELGKMGKSLKNAVAPDDICRDYGADTLRLYEMYMGPLDASKPWNTRDIIGVHRFLQRLWRNLVDEETGKLKVTDAAPSADLLRLLHGTIDAVRKDMIGLGFNTAIARLMELNNALTSLETVPREVATTVVKLLAPLAPHVAEELWSRLGHGNSLAYEPFPEADPSLLVADLVEIPVMINGKVRARLNVPPAADPAAIEALARRDGRVQELIAGKQVVKVVAVTGRMISFVVS